MKTNCVTWLIKTKSPTNLQRAQFVREFGKIDNSNKLVFMQDGAECAQVVVEQKYPKTMDWKMRSTGLQYHLVS